MATGEPIGDPLILDYLSVNLLENGQSLGLDGGPLNFGEQLQLRSVALIDKDGNPVADSSTSPSVPQSTAWQAGDSIQLDITWQTLKMSAMPLTGFVHMTGPSGELVAQDDHPVIHDFIPHTMWSPWQRLPDRFMLQLPDDAALGDYTLFIGLYHPETGQRLTFDVDGQQQDALRWMSIPVR